jgi:hypothetical protein
LISYTEELWSFALKLPEAFHFRQILNELELANIISKLGTLDTKLNCLEMEHQI